MRLAWLWIILLLTALTTRAAGPDGLYFQIYNSLQQADALNQDGKFRPAAEKYQEVAAELKKFSATYPQWNSSMIQFRQSYVAERLESLIRFLPRPLSPSAAATAAALEAKASTGTPANETNPDEIKELREAVTRLEAEKDRLEGKLREALAVKPATSEWTPVEDKVAALERERDLLKVALDQAKSAQIHAEPSGASSPSDPKRIKALEKERDELLKKLAAANKQQEAREARYIAEMKEAQTKLRQLEKLNQDREELAKKLKEALALAEAAAQTAPDGKISKSDARQLKKLEKEKAELAQKFEALSADLTSLQNDREMRIRAHQSALDKIKELEKGRAALEKRLRATPATREIAANNQLSLENQQLRSRLETYEARPVPFTPEELALFKKPEAPSQPKSFEISSKMTKGLPSKAKALVAAADQDFASRRLTEAEQKYQQALAQNEKNVYALANLASVQIELHRLDEAEKNLQRALQLDDNDAFSLLLLGKLKLSTGKLDESLDALSRSAQLNPRSGETQNYLGIVLSEKGQRVPAEAALRKAIQIQPDYASAHHNLAIIYATQKPPFLELARWHYDKAVTLGHAKNAELEKLMGERSENHP